MQASTTYIKVGCNQPLQNSRIEIGERQVMILLIGGQMRSGTTLLRDLCNSHPEIAITNEFYYLSGLGKTYAQHSYRLFKRFWEITIRNKMKLKWHLYNYVFIARYLFNMRRHRDGLINAAAIEATLRDIFPNTRIVGDKQPYYLFLLDKFAATNGLSCLIIFRDCRDVAGSMLGKARTEWRKNPWVQKNFNTAEKIAKRWVLGIELMERHQDKIHIIRYEDLVQHPTQKLERLANWLGVDPAGFPIDMIRDSSIGKYKTRLTNEELKTVMEIAGPTMKRIGYI